MDKLLAYLKSHDVHAIEQDGELWAVDVFTRIGYPGKVFAEWVKVEPTLKAVRAFLNY